MCPTREDHNERLLSSIRHLVDDDILKSVQTLLENHNSDSFDDTYEGRDEITTAWRPSCEIPAYIKPPTENLLLPLELLDIIFSYSTIANVLSFTSTCLYYHYPRDDRFMPDALRNHYSTNSSNEAVFDTLASIIESGTHISEKAISWFSKACAPQIDDILTRQVFWNDRTFFNGQGRTLLSIAARGGYVKAVKALLQQPNANANQLNFDGSNPLHQAAANGHVDVVKILIHTKGCFVDATRDKDGATPLYLAAIGGHAETVRVLVQQGGAEMGKACCYPNNYTPLWAATYHGKEEVVKVLVSLGAGVDDTLAKEHSNQKSQNLLIQHQQHNSFDSII